MFSNSLLKKYFCSKIQNIKKVGVIGSGQMGTGIAYVFGKYGKMLI